MPKVTNVNFSQNFLVLGYYHLLLYIPVRVATRIASIRMQHAIYVFYQLRPYGLVSTDDPYLYIVHRFNYIMSICRVCAFCSICPYPHAHLICLICQFAILASICRYANMYYHNFCPKKKA